MIKMSDPVFIRGLELNREFFREAVKPLVEKTFPGLKYSAALLGYGSDVLGMDTEVSVDHNWGPRMQTFVNEKEIIPRPGRLFKEELPFEYRGYTVNFPDPSYDKTQGWRRPQKSR